MGLEIAILRQQFRTFAAIPALGALSLATLPLLDDGAHRYLLLLKPFFG